MPLLPRGVPRTYSGPVSQLCKWCLEEEGAHDEVYFRNKNMVGQKVVQDPEAREQAGALVRHCRAALQVVW